MAKIRVLVVDDHPLMREALCSAVSDESDLELAGEASNGETAIEQNALLQPDVILMDLFMPGKNGLEATAEIHQKYPAVRILVLTSSNDEHLVSAAMQSGAMGYLLKDARRIEILQAIRTISQGVVYLPGHLARKVFDALRNTEAADRLDAEKTDNLTRRERQVLELMGEGASNAEIADRLVLTEGTVRTHVHNLLEKLHLKNRNQAILYTLKHK